jgi:hypothetical protein
MVLAESELSHRAAEESLPLRDAFAVLFFVSVGMLFDPTIPGARTIAARSLPRVRFGENLGPRTPPMRSLRRGIAHLGDDEPVEFFLNNVATKASFGVRGEGDTNIDVEPNYTCKPAA